MATKYSIDTPTRRKKLPPRREPYWHKITTGRYLGYRKTDRGGRWIARLRGDDGKQRYQSLDDKIEYDEAVRAAGEWFGTAEIIEDTRYTLRAAVDDYVDHLKINNSAYTSKHARNRMDYTLSDKLLNTELASLTTAMLKRWHDGLVRVSDDAEDMRKSKDTANRTLATLRAALNLAFNSGLVASDQAWKRVRPFKNVGASRKVFLTDKEVAALIDKATGAFSDLLTAAKLTGARYNELTGARVADLDIKQGRIHLDGKTGTRFCYLSDEALAWFKGQTKDKLPAALLLPKDDGTQWKRSHQQNPFDKAKKAAKLPTGTVFYSLRHYHISKALLACIPVQVVAENCGTSIRMIEKHYGKFLAQDRREFFNQVSL